MPTVAERWIATRELKPGDVVYLGAHIYTIVCVEHLDGEYMPVRLRFMNSNSASAWFGGEFIRLLARCCL